MASRTGNGKQYKMRKTVAVVVCYHPVFSTLLDLSNNLYLEGVPVIWVNNGPEGSLAEVRSNSVLNLIELKSNLGVAAALNAGFQWAIDNQFEAVITFDQDSKPQQGMVGKLLQSWVQASTQTLKIAAIGPATIDHQSGQALFSFEPYNWIRRRFLPKQAKVYAVDQDRKSGV
jgi:rhamnosyltransferase